MQRRSTRSAPLLNYDNRQLALIEKTNRKNRSQPRQMAQNGGNNAHIRNEEPVLTQAQLTEQVAEQKRAFDQLKAAFDARVEQEREAVKTIGDADTPHTFYQNLSAICPVEIPGRNFEIKPSMINLVKQELFHGLPAENPMEHIEKFEETCTTSWKTGEHYEYVMCKLFPFTLAGKAQIWLKSLPPASITTWEDCRATFIDHFFTKSKTAALRNQIISFSQRPGESFNEAWERFKSYRRECPHHGYSDEQLLRMFYDGCQWEYKNALNAASNGDFNTQSIQGAYKLIENMAASSSSSSAEYDRTKKSTSADSQKIEELTSKINQLLKSSQRGVHQVDETAEPVQFLEGPEPEGDQEVNFIYGQGFGQNRGYNPNFRGNNNNYLSYRSTNVANPQDQKYPPAQPGQYQPFRPANSNQDLQRNNQGYRSYQGNQYQRGPQPQAPYPNPNEDLKGMMQQLLQQQQKMDVDIQDKTGTMYTDLNGKIERLTSHMKAIDAQLVKNTEEIKQSQETQTKKEEGGQVFSIRESKDIKMVQKLGDPGKFAVTVKVKEKEFPDSTCDLGSSVNVMTYSVAKNLGFSNLDSTSIHLIMADQSAKKPEGTLKDVVITIKELPGVSIPTDFVVLETNADFKEPIILGRPFLRTAGAIFDVGTGMMTWSLSKKEKSSENNEGITEGSSIPVLKPEIQTST